MNNILNFIVFLFIIIIGIIIYFLIFNNSHIKKNDLEEERHAEERHVEERHADVEERHTHAEERHAHAEEIHAEERHAEEIHAERQEKRYTEIKEEINQKKIKENKINKDLYIYLKIGIENQFKEPNIGTIIIKLYNNTPKTSMNFITLCEEKKYINTKIHRVIKNFMIQTGDFENNNGTGGFSIYGKTFEDENFINSHDRPGLLSMANSGPNTNGSQFFITTTECKYLDNKHVVFGEVISGLEYVYDIENQITDNNDEPIRKCFISDCGLYNME